MKKLFFLSSLLIGTSLFAQPWHRTNDPYGSTVYGLYAYHDSVLYAGCGYGALYAYNGSTWNKLNYSNMALGFTSLGDTLFIASSGGGVYATGDKGNTFVSKNNGLNGADISLMAVSGTVLYGAGSTGIYRSTDGGNNWTSLNSQMPNTYINQVRAIGNDVYVLTNAGITLSSDNGVSWTTLNNASSLYFLDIAKHNNKLYAGTSSGIYVSNDNGQTWNTAGTISKETRYLFSDGTNLYASTTSGVYTSSNNGSTWQQINNQLPVNYSYNYVLYNSEIYLGTYLGVFKTANKGGAWTNVNKGIHPSISCMHSDGNRIYVGTGSAAYSTSDGGQNWSFIMNGLVYPYPSGFSTINTVGNILYAGTSSGLYSSTDYGSTWARNTTLPYASVDGFANNNSSIFIGDASGNGIGVYRSDDKGNTWTDANNGLSTNGIRSLACYQDSILIAATYDGVYKSSDKGGNWSLKLNGYSSLAATYDSVFFSVDNSNFLHRSIDKGNSWSSIFCPTSVYCITRTSGGLIYVGGNNGIFYSNNYGATWIADSAGLTGKTITALTIKDTILYAATNDGGVYTKGNFLLSSINTPKNTIGKIAVHPNPSNDGIFYIDGITMADIKEVCIYDMTGRLVLKANSAIPQINLSAEEKGIYYLKLTLKNGNIQSQKLLVY